MLSPDEKYRTDTQYRMFVDTLEAMIRQAQFTPSEIREAAIYAAIRYECTQPPRPIVMRARAQDVDDFRLKCPSRMDYFIAKHAVKPPQPE